MGQFNKWTPELMETFSQDEVDVDNSKTNVFYYKARLLPGFKFRYYFQVEEEGEFVVDPSKPISKSRFNKDTNTIELEAPKNLKKEEDGFPEDEEMVGTSPLLLQKNISFGVNAM